MSARFAEPHWSSSPSRLSVQTMTDLSRLPERSIPVSSIVLAMHVTQSLWPARVASGFESATVQSRTIRSAPLLASVPPSGEKATAQIASVWPSSRPCSVPSATFQSFRSLSPPPLTSVWPSFEKARQVAAASWAAIVFSSVPVAVSQSTTVPSSPAEASRVPSGEKATARAQPLCFRRSCLSFRLDASQSLTRPS